MIRKNQRVIFLALSVSITVACQKNKSLEPDGKSIILMKYAKSSSEADSLSYFPLPFGISESDDQKIYIASMVDNKVYVLNQDLAKVNTIGSAGQAPGELLGPAYLTIRNNLLYVVEWGNNRLSIFSLDGEFKKVIKLPLFFRGVNIAIDSHEKIYVVNTSSDDLITVLDGEGLIITSFGEKIDRIGASIRYSNIGLLTIDEEDNLYVVFPTHCTVRKYQNQNLAWEIDHSTFKPLSWYFETMNKSNTDQAYTQTNDAGKISEGMRYIASDCAFYQKKLYIRYEGTPPHGAGIYEIDPSSGRIERIFLFSHLKYRNTLYDINNFFFVRNGRVVACDRNTGQVILFSLNS